MEWVAAVVAIGLFGAALTGPQSLMFDAVLESNLRLPELFAQPSLTQQAGFRALTQQPTTDTGEPVHLAARIIAAEGGPGQNPLSSAAGYGQFLSGTWLEIFQRAYPQLARIMRREQILALRDVKPLAANGDGGICPVELPGGC